MSRFNRSADTDTLLARYARSRSPADLEELVRRHTGLARRLARRYAYSGPGLEDLEQVAHVGLIKAIRRFDPGRGCTFTTFAVPTIAGELKRYCRDTSWAAHVPRGMQERVRAIRTEADRMQAERGAAPSPRELAVHVGLDEEEIGETLCAAAAMSTVPLEPEGERAAVDSDRLSAEDPHFELIEQRAAIRDVVWAVSDAEREILRLRFFEDRSQREIADAVGIPPRQVARRLDAALDRLRAAADSEHQALAA
jgi:RNA polymerase sigma-B factor